MQITKELIDKIIQTGKDSNFGLDDPETDLDLDGYAQHNFETLAMILVGAYHAKYDLVSVFAAALQEVSSRSNREGFEKGWDEALFAYNVKRG